MGDGLQSFQTLSLISFQLLPVRCLETPVPRQPACRYLSLGAILGRRLEHIGSQSCPRGPHASCIALQHLGPPGMFGALGAHGVLGMGLGTLLSEGSNRKPRGRVCGKTLSVHSPANKLPGSVRTPMFFVSSGV